MAIHTLTWSLDTCACQIELTYDDTTPLDTRTYTPSNYINVCSFHSGISDINTRHSTVVEENQRKNNARQTVLDNAPTTIIDTMPDGTKQLKRGISIDFTVTGTAPNRVVTLTVTGINLTNQQKNNIQNFLDNRFGAGKVILG